MKGKEGRKVGSEERRERREGEERVKIKANNENGNRSRKGNKTERIREIGCR